jgi:hypothetical protein
MLIYVGIVAFTDLSRYLFGLASMDIRWPAEAPREVAGEATGNLSASPALRN